MKIGGALIEVDITSVPNGLSCEALLEWVQRAAESVSTFYGRFPVRHARVVITLDARPDHTIHGTTWGDVGGVQGLSRMRIGGKVNKADLDQDWTMTHELVHLAVASLPDQQHWFEEGLATYVEPIARAQSGQMEASKVWEGMIAGMPQGEPEKGDRGLDRTHTWGRTYWGGAMFCFIADIQIRKKTENRTGLQDALRAIVAAGATIDTERPLSQILQTGDKATGTTVLTEMYGRWRDDPMPIDLDRVWLQLGVSNSDHGITLDPKAPLAHIRASITAPRHDR
jgi:hypothetical protein